MNTQNCRTFGRLSRLLAVWVTGPALFMAVGQAAQAQDARCERVYLEGGNSRQAADFQAGSVSFRQKTSSLYDKQTSPRNDKNDDPSPGVRSTRSGKLDDLRGKEPSTRTRDSDNLRGKPTATRTRIKDDLTALAADRGLDPESLSRRDQTALAQLPNQIQRLRAAHGLRVLWWNVANGQLAGDGSLKQNLQLLTRSQLKPEVMALGEVSTDLIRAQLAELATNAYAHQYFIPYSESSPDLGIYILSSLPIRQAKSRLLGWVPEGLSAEDEAAYRLKWGSESHDDHFYLRTIVDLRVLKDGREISVVPVHLAQPWRQIRETTPNKILAILKTFKEIFWGRRNPLFTQVEALRGWLDQDGDIPRVVVGDFNLPRGFMGVTSQGFRELTRTFTNTVSPGAVSFPTASSPLRAQYPSLQIDHALVSGDFTPTAVEILPLKGSDHSPIYGVFAPEPR